MKPLLYKHLYLSILGITSLQTSAQAEIIPHSVTATFIEPYNQSYTIPISQLKQKEAELTNSKLMRQVKYSITTLDNQIIEKIVPNSKTNPDNVKRVESIISSKDWDFLFSKRNVTYTYNNFLKAIGKFPAFCGGYSDNRDADAICRKSLATMFAHFTQETGGHNPYEEVPEWRQGLFWVREMGWNETMRGGYNSECNPDTWQGRTWPCGTFKDGEFKSYFGRGAKQLSYNYNYGPFSDAMFGTIRTLLDHPEKVADTWLNLASAVFFFVYPQPPKPSMLHVVEGTWQPNQHDHNNGLFPGFGVTTQIINGGVECGATQEHKQSLNRIRYYQSFTQYLNVPITSSEVLGCANMQRFDNQGSGALAIYWEQDWRWDPSTPTGKSYACKLVNYQTPFTALKQGDYIDCVVHHFKDVIIDPDN
ncbi:chitinase [Spartinivicinus ruber]|uniref:chitinase n=1 Tax=Spartinivicinus ruber TaxID=2683272 RepID=UPI0015B4A095|nr:chitinase [Spartinivicinus ruber]